MAGERDEGNGGTSGSAPGSWLVCRAGAVFNAIPLAHVIETMRALPIEPIAGAPAYVRGVAIVRGVPVPAVDIGLLTGSAATRAARMVTVRAGGRTVALLVDAVTGIRAIDPVAAGALPPLLRGAAGEAIQSIGAHDADLLLVLEAARLVPPEMVDAMTAAEAAA